MKNINILNNLNSGKTSSYFTTNGTKEFTCENDGYVDNVVIEGETLVNLNTFTAKGYDGNRIWFYDTNYSLCTNNAQYTILNTSDKLISIQYTLNGNWVDGEFIYLQPNTSQLVTVYNNHQFGGIFGGTLHGWSNSDNSYNELKQSIIILEGDHTGKSISYFEGLKSVGQGDDIEVLTINGSKYDLSGATYATGFFNPTGGLNPNEKHKVIEQYLEVEEGKTYVLENIAQATCYYDVNKNLVHYNIETLICNSPYPQYKQGIHHVFYSVVKIPKGIKYIRVSTGINSVGKINIYKDGKYDHKQISTTLRSLQNGVKDTIEKRGNKYVKVQRCGEVTLNGNESDDKIIEGVPTATTYRFGFVLSNLAENPPDAICVSDKFPSECNNNWTSDKEQVDQDRGSVNIRILKTKLADGTKTSIKNWLKSNPITIVYQLATPQIIELSNFNPQTFEGGNTLIINSGVIQCDASFDVCEGIRSELDVIKDKVSNLDDYESGYEFSNEVIYLNGTYKPGFAETPYIVRIGKMCILHCAIGNDAPQRGMHILKLPSFAKPKDHHRCAGRAKINDETINPILVDYDITLDNTVQLWTTHETTKLNELYIHMIWEVE